MWVRVAIAPSCSGFTISQIGRMMAEWTYSCIPRHAIITALVLKNDGVEIELGSIGVQFDGWNWGIDNIIPCGRRTAKAAAKTGTIACGNSERLGAASVRIRLD
jgi:hypothetical protein